jgi:hypothetical protein
MKNIYKIFIGILFIINSGFSQNTYSLNFDGVNDVVSVSPIDSLNNFEIHATFKSTNSNNQTQGIFAWIDHVPPYNLDLISLFLHINGHLEVQLRKQGAGTTHQISSSAILSGDNTWHQAKVVYNQGTLELWLDQILVGSTSSININKISNSGNIEIGGFTYGNNDKYLPGLINNIKLINNQNDIIDFRFQAGSGTVLNDFSGNGNNGTISGATWSTDVP